MGRATAGSADRQNLLDGAVARHPFVAWYASLWRSKAARWQDKDLVLDELGAKRFAIGVDPGGIAVLGVLDEDVPALTAFRWTSAAFVRGHQGGDWVALSCKDARIRRAETMEPVPLRLWIPVTSAVMDAWSEAKPERLRIRAVAVEGGRPSESGRPAINEVPLALKGWPVS